MFQGNNKSFKADYYLGTQMPYHVMQQFESKPPIGYQAFYINFLGKHCVKNYLDYGELDGICEILYHAYEKQLLTIRGLELLSKVVGIKELEKTGKKNITHQNRKMIEGIANRIYELYPNVFGKKILGCIGQSEYTSMALQIFCAELKKYLKEDKFQIFYTKKEDPVLGFYKINEAYKKYKKKGKWIERYYRFQQREDYTESILRRIFLDTHDDELHLSELRKRELIEQLYNVYISQVDTSGVIGLGYYFNKTERHYLWENLNLKNYLLHGPSGIMDNLAVNISFPLLEEFITTSDAAIQSDDISMNVRFCDTGTIIPFSALLGIDYCSEQTDQLCKTSIVWKDYEVAPLAANVQWIFYCKNSAMRNRLADDKNILVKMKYNEQEVNFPFESETAPYYRWSEVKKYYMNKLEELHIVKKNTMLETLRTYPE